MTALFELRSISFAYGTRTVLDGAALTLRAGERVGLLGGNGVGKSTLLRLMVGLVRPQAGVVAAFGRERRAERDFHEVRRRAGLVFQDPDDQLFCPSVWEDVAFGPHNLGWPRARIKAAVQGALARLGIEHLAERAPHHLSGGEKRLVALATVLAMEPEVLLLDEPTAGLDDEARSRLIGVIKGLPQAMVLVAHDRDLHDQLATRRLRLAHGRLDPVGDEAFA